MDAAPGPSYRGIWCISTCATALTYDFQFCPGLFPGLGNALHGVGHLAVEHMRIARGGLDIGVIERPLHQLEVARRAQQLAGEVVPEIMKPKAGHRSALAQISPMAFNAAVGERITLALG